VVEKKSECKIVGVCEGGGTRHERKEQRGGRKGEGRNVLKWVKGVRREGRTETSDLNGD